MPARIQLSHILRKYVPDYNHDTGILLEDADGWSVRQIIERLAIPPGEVVTIMVNSYPASPASTVAEGGSVTLTKVIGGGCSGLQYQLMFEPEADQWDQELVQNGVRLLIDSKSAVYLAGATIDFVDDLTGSGFKIDNPNATSTCGCGQSFGA